MREDEPITVERDLDETRLVLHGEIDLGVHRDLASTTRALCADPPSYLRVILADVSFIDVHSLGIIADAIRALRATGCHATVEAASPAARRVLTLTGDADVLRAS